MRFSEAGTALFVSIQVCLCALQQSYCVCLTISRFVSSPLRLDGKDTRVSNKSLILRPAFTLGAVNLTI